MNDPAESVTPMTTDNGIAAQQALITQYIYNKKSVSDDEALGISCPTCAAAPNVPCTYVNEPFPEAECIRPHHKRREAARAARAKPPGWRPPAPESSPLGHATVPVTPRTRKPRDQVLVLIVEHRVRRAAVAATIGAAIQALPEVDRVAVLVKNAHSAALATPLLVDRRQPAPAPNDKPPKPRPPKKMATIRHAQVQWDSRENAELRAWLKDNHAIFENDTGDREWRSPNAGPPHAPGSGQ